MSLTLIPTPLGNLGDMTLRSLEALRTCELLFAEDTRVARRLLAALDIPPPPLRTFHAHSSSEHLDAIVDAARERRVGLVTDAGTPGISDPGSELVRAARAADVAVELLPGPCAMIGAAVLSGFSIVGMSFGGFVPRGANQRRSAFTAALTTGNTSVWYESPHRILATLATLAEIEPDRPLFLLREYTKHFEQQLFDRPAQVAAALPQPPRGECVIVLGGQPLRRAQDAAFETTRAQRLADALEIARDRKLPATALAKRLAAEGYGDRRTLYQHILRYRANLVEDQEGSEEEP